MKLLIEKLANRGTTLCGFDYDGGDYRNRSGNQVDVEKRNREYLRTLASNVMLDLSPAEGDSDDLRKQKKDSLQLIQDALRGDRNSQRTLAAIRLEQVDNFVKAGSNFMSFWNIVTLKDNDQPYIQNTTQNEIRVGYLSEDGKPKSVKIERPTAETSVPLRELATEHVWYRTRDIYKGNIAELATKTFEIGRDMQIRFDREAYTLMTASLGYGGPYGTFSLTGAKVSRIYVPHSVIDTSHFPTTNDLTVKRRTVNTANGGQVKWLDANDAAVANEAAAVINGFFGVAVLQDVVRYCTKWGDIFPDGRLVPTGEIIVPAIDVDDIILGLGSVQLNTFQTKVQDQIQANGFADIGRWFGVDWRLIPDVTIPSGVCYPRLNKAPGNVYLKPSMDEEFVEIDNQKHTEARWQTKVFGITTISQRRMNVVRCTYK